MLRLATEEPIFRGAAAAFLPLRLTYCAGFRTAMLLFGRDPTLPRVLTVESGDEQIVLGVDTDDLIISITLKGTTTEMLPVGLLYAELWLFAGDLKRVAAIGFPVVHDTLLA